MTAGGADIHHEGGQPIQDESITFHVLVWHKWAATC